MHLLISWIICILFLVRMNMINAIIRRIILNRCTKLIVKSKVVKEEK